MLSHHILKFKKVQFFIEICVTKIGLKASKYI